MNLRREVRWKAVTLTTDQATSPDIDLGECGGGLLYVPDSSTITEVTFYVVDDSGNVLAALDDEGAALVRSVAENQAIPLPDALFAAATIRIKGDAAGAVKLSLKG